MRARTYFQSAFALIFVISPWVHASDIFVAPSKGPQGGDGSRQHPYYDPYLAFRNAEAGDTIHIAGGRYHGRYDRSSWEIDRPRLTVLGGYDADFTKRDPWKTPSVFGCANDCVAQRESFLLQGMADHSGITLDGLTFDSAGRNSYESKGSPPGVIPSSSDGAMLVLTSPDVTVKNCTFLNSTTGAVELTGENSRFENNLVLNTTGIAALTLHDSSAHNAKPIIVQSNTFAFVHDVGDPPLATGADRSVGVRVQAPAQITDNAFIFCANAGISLLAPPEKVSIDGNLFYMMPHDLVTKRSGDVADVTTENLDEIGDLGVKSAKDNVVKDPGLSGISSPWVNAVTRFSLVNYAKPPKEGLSALRESAKLPRDPSGDDKGSLAPQVDLKDLASVQIKSKQGAHAVELTVQISNETAPAESKSYRTIEFAALLKPDTSLNNQPVEVKAAIGGEQNFYMLPEVKEETHVGFFLLDKASEEQRLVYGRRNSRVQRQFQECINTQNAREAEDFYMIRGVYRVGEGERPKATILVDSISPAPPAEFTPPKRPQGQDWFVKAGAQGGDGSRDKPFRDPFQALDKAKEGDTIRVAGGDYFGKLKSGKWKIPAHYIALRGGYSADFSSRDPWSNPTRFVLSPQEKAKHNHPGTFLSSDDPVDGFILDGFVIDGSSINTYSKNGGLDLSAETPNNLIDLGSGQGSIVVRNCVFVNANGSGGRVGAASGAFENNVILNSSGWGFTIESDRGPWVIRNNTFLFASDPTERAGTGKSSAAGTLLHLRGHGNVVVESNVFAFADNYAVRVTADQRYVSFNKNVFGGALYCTLNDTQYLYANQRNFNQQVVVDANFVSAKDNSFDVPRIALDRSFVDTVLGRMTVLPSKLRTDDWRALLTAAGSSLSPPRPGSDKAEKKAEKAPPPKKDSSLDDLMADLGKAQKEKASSSNESAKEPKGPPYCPAYSYKDAAKLASSDDAQPGAHKIKLEP